MKSKIIRVFIAGLVLLMVGSSCKEWLDVKPKTQVSEDHIFESEEGYQDVLLGVYSLINSEQLYSKNLSTGILDVMAHYFDAREKFYANYLVYDYDAADVQKNFARIWGGMYTSIAHVNNLLDHLTSDDLSKFGGNQFKIIRGEALGLRALLHFDLLRMFAPSFKLGADQKAIIYRKQHSLQINSQKTTEEILDLILDDLDEAEDLLELTDPILNDIHPKDRKAFVTGFLKNRTNKMNYYAVKALKARVYLYYEKYEQALEEALTVIDSKKFPFATETNVSKGDVLLSKEIIFGLASGKISDIFKKKLCVDGDERIAVSSFIIEDIYESNELDWRKEHWFKKIVLDNSVGSDGNDYLTKYYFQDSNGIKDLRLPEIPILRLSEMYYIAAECEMKMGNPNEKALYYIDEVRLSRGIQERLEDTFTGSLTEDSFYEFLEKEFRKEMIGEGQLFFHYKRRNRNILKLDEEIEMTPEMWTFPLPMMEKEYGDVN